MSACDPFLPLEIAPQRLPRAPRPKREEKHCDNAAFLFDIQTLSREAVRERKQRGDYGQINERFARMWWDFTRGK